MPWNPPFRNAPELPGGTGLSNVTVVVALAEIVKVCAFDVPPPGAGLNTVTCAVPGLAMSVSGIEALTCEDETNAVGRSTLFHRTIDPGMKLLPFTVSVNAGPPAVADVGLRLVVVGTGLVAAVIVNVCAFDVPPPGAGLNTVTCAVPGLAMSESGIEALTCEDETNVVGRFEPFHRTIDPGMKLLPFTVSVNAGPPAVADVGLRLVVVGTGLVAAVIVNVCAFDVPPPGAGLNTVTSAVPGLAMSVSEIEALTCDDETNAVGRLELFHRTIDPGMKLLPFTVSVNAGPPALADVGLRLVVVGTGLVAAVI